jgi:peptidoglycan/LPS O-acetylase OafA/YrhL
MGIAYRPEIDGLRAIAVLAVVAFHAGLGGAGYVGVDVFFVISGYLITALLLREHAATGRIDLLAFYARRVRRIFPAVAVVVLAVLAVSTLILPPVPQAHTANSAGASLVFFANVFFQFTSGGYFDSSAEEMPLLHLWSLSVEEQFYFVWPALLILLLRYGRERQGIVVLGLASFLLAELLTEHAAFYQMPARFWELAAGGLIAALPARRLPAWAAPVGIALTVAACLWQPLPFPGVGALPAVAGASLLIAAVHGGATNALLACRPMVWVGLISYSIYLWHWPLLAFYRATTVGDGELATRLILCALAFPLAFASYRYVEQPIRRMRWPKGRTVAIGFGASAVVALSACMVGMRAPPPPDADPFPTATAAEIDQPPLACSYRTTDDAFPRCPITQANAIWGDSMAFAWRPGVEAAFGDVADLSRQACGPYLGYMPDNPMPGHKKCADFNASAIAAMRGMDTVVVSAKWQVDQPRLRTLPSTLDALAPNVRRVVILGPTPSMRESVPKCIRTGQLDACAVPRLEFDALAAPVLRAMREAAAPHHNVEVVDLTDHFCTAASCPPILDGVPLYWDSHHVSSTHARRVGESLRQQAASPD